MPTSSRWNRGAVHTAALALMASAAFLSLAAGARAADPPRQASGKFSGTDWSFEPLGAYAFPSKVGMEDEPGVRVAISNATFKAEAFDAWVDRQHVIETYFKDDQTLIVYFDFAKSGAYKGMSYYFGSGDGCGFCYNGAVQSTVKLEGGRAKGKLQLPPKEGDASWDLEFDVPIAPADHGTPLAAGGGEPGKVYMAYHAALGGDDLEAIRKFMLDSTQAQWAEKRDGIVAAFRKDHPGKSAQVVKGWVSGDRANLLIDGETTYDMKATTEVLMIREKGSWRIKDELLQAKLGS